MRKNIIAIIIISIIIIASIFYLSPQKKESQECLQVSSLIDLKYTACYNANLNSISLKITRLSDTENTSQLTIILDNKITLSDLPEISQTKTYLFSSTKLKTLEILPVIENKKICSAKTINIGECEPGMKSNISIGDAEKITNITLQPESKDTTKVYKNISLFDLACNSSWVCSEWEQCEDNIQKRACFDKNNCTIPNNLPDFSRDCRNICKEDWQCSWSECINGNIKADCTDKNNCGTEFTKPANLSCNAKKQSCTPEISCSEFSDCHLDYNLISFYSGIQAIHGIKTRVCTDKNNCIYPVYESRICSTSIDIYLKKCNNSIAVYNKLDNTQVSELGFQKERLDLKFFIFQKSESC